MAPCACAGDATIAAVPDIPAAIIAATINGLKVISSPLDCSPAGEAKFHYLNGN
jgi:hypothetical protein